MISSYIRESWRFVLGVVLTFLLLIFMQTQEAYAAEFSCSNVPGMPHSECNALVALYNTTGGEYWENGDDWLTAEYPCRWTGVSCSYHNKEYRIKKLELSSMGLTGYLPDTLDALEYLEVLDVSHNKLVGPIPKSVGNLLRLKELEVGNNEMFGMMPSTLHQLDKLTLFDYENTFICLPRVLYGFSRGIDTVKFSYRLCQDLPSDVDNCDGGKPNLDQTPDSYKQIILGEHKAKWTYSFSSTPTFRIMSVTVYFTCNRDGEEVVLARRTREWYCGNYELPESTDNAYIEDKSDEGYFTFYQGQTMTCEGRGVSVQDIVYRALKDHHPSIKSPEDAFPSQVTLSMAGKEVFDIGAQIIAIDNDDCSNARYQTIFRNNDLHLYLSPTLRGRRPYIRVNKADILTEFSVNIAFGSETFIYAKYYSIIKDVVSNEAYLNEGVAVHNYHNRMTLSTQLTEINIGHSYGRNHFCGYIKSILIDPHARVGGN